MSLLLDCPDTCTIHHENVLDGSVSGNDDSKCWNIDGNVMRGRSCCGSSRI